MKEIKIDRLKEILALGVKKRILVLGDVGIDRYTIGTVERISPEAPVPVVLVQEERLKLGLAANVAENIHALGGVPLLVGVIGKDRCAKDLKDLLKKCRIQTSFLVEDLSRRTSLKERVVSERQQLVRIDYESNHSVSEATEKKCLKVIQDLLPRVEGLLIEDYSKGTLSPTLLKKVIRLAKKAKKLIAIDPNAKTATEGYQGATLLTPNTKEAEALSGISIRNESDLIRAGFGILERTRAKHIVVTRGKDGMAIFSEGHSRVRMIPTYAREVYDVSGAGDTVISMMTLALLSTASIEEAAVLGNLAAGVEVAKRGTATVSPSEMHAALELAKWDNQTQSLIVHPRKAEVVSSSLPRGAV